MELHRFILTKSKLAALPQAERSLLLLLGHASNEINVLSKLILMVMRKDTPPSQIANNVEAGQVCVLLRVLVGQLHEAWELFRRRVSRRRKGSRPIARATRRSLPRVGSRRWKSGSKPRWALSRPCNLRSRNSTTRSATNRRRASICCVGCPDRLGEQGSFAATLSIFEVSSAALADGL